MRWGIFYGDGSMFSHEKGSHVKAPTYGVITIVQDCVQPPQVLHQCDFYWWRDDMWWGGDIFGFIQQAARFGATWLKEGQTILPGDYKEIMARAVDLRDAWNVRY